jgi:hypothetical protein
MAFDPKELRGRHGEWTKGGATIERLSKEAAGGHERTLAQVNTVKPGAGKQINGHWVDRPESEGGKYRVKLRKPGERGRDTRTYESPEDAARALHTGSHTSPATERAARDVSAGSRPSGPSGKAPSPEEPSPAVREVRAGELKPGMVVSSGHWQAPSGPHEITKLEKSGAGTRSGGVRHSQGIYNTASTHVHHKDGKYQVSNNTKFKVHREAPAEGHKPEPHTLTGETRQAYGTTQHAVLRPDGRSIEWTDEGSALHRAAEKGTSDWKFAGPGQPRAKGHTPPPQPGGEKAPYYSLTHTPAGTVHSWHGSLEAARKGSSSVQSKYRQHVDVYERSSSTSGVTPELMAKMREIDAEQKAKMLAENEATGRGGVTRNTGAGTGVGKPDIRGGAAPPKTGTPVTRYNGMAISAMSGRQLANAAKKPGSPQAIKDEIARRYRQEKLREIGHIRGSSKG